MSARKLIYLCAATVATIAPSVARGQADAFCDVNCYHEQQWFAPVDFDFDCRPIDRDCGYFFNYSKLSWYVSGERTPIGAPGRTVLSEDIWPEVLAADPGQDPPPPYTVINGIQDAVPGEFGDGDRFEIGYFSGQHGIMAGLILDQGISTNQVIGNGPQLSGFGSIHVNFDLANPQLLHGFRDYNGVVVNGTEVPTPITNGPGGISNGAEDDLDADLFSGTGFFFFDANGNGVFDAGDPITGIFADYGDGYEFNVTFNQINIRNSTRTDGVELMKTYMLDNSHWFTKEQAGQFEIGAGVRFMRVKDEFGFAGFSDLMRDELVVDPSSGLILDVQPGVRVNTDVENQIVGPQIYARYTRQVKRLQWGAGGRMLFGYNVQDLKQDGVIAAGNTPGGLNQPFILQPTRYQYGRQDHDFSPVIEFRADATYRLTSALSAKLGYTAIFADNITRAASVTRWFLPDMGFTEPGQQYIFMNGVDLGFELVY